MHRRKGGHEYEKHRFSIAGLNVATFARYRVFESTISEVRGYCVTKTHLAIRYSRYFYPKTSHIANQFHIPTKKATFTALDQSPTRQK